MFDREGIYMTNHSNHDEQNRIDLELEYIYYNFKHNFYRIRKQGDGSLFDNAPSAL